MTASPAAAEVATHAPAAPVVTATAESSSQVNLSWGAVSGASGYLVYEWVGHAWTQIGSLGGSATEDSVTGLTAKTTYYFDVAARNSSGCTWSSMKTVATLESGPPAAPTLTATAESSTQVNLSWGAVSGATGYLVEQWVGSAWSQIGSVGSSVTKDTVSGLSADTTYYFDLVAYNAAGSSWANYQSATTLGGGPPAAPAFTATAESSSQINLSWGAVSGASGYLVDEWINGAWSQIGSLGGSATSDSVTGLAASTTYYFDVAADNASGVSWANYESATTSSGASGSIDHPAAATAYTPVSGTLFGASGPLFTDVHQGQEGDCWLMSSLAAVAARDPGDITSMFTADGTTVENGSVVNVYLVRLYNSAGVAEYVKVDTELPSGGEYYDNVVNGVLWVALAEKAYAQANGEGIVTTSYADTDSYDSLNGGYPSWALQAITGKSSSDYSIDPTNIAAAWNAGELIVLGSSSAANDNLIVGDSEGTHAYAVVSYNASSSSPFELYNPWGLSSTVGGTVSYNGQQVYGGAFYASASLISQDFSDQFIGSGAAAPTAALAGGSQQGAGSSAGAAADAVMSRATFAGPATAASATVMSTTVISTTAATGEAPASRSGTAPLSPGRVGSPETIASAKPQAAVAIDHVFAGWTGEGRRSEIARPLLV